MPDPTSSSSLERLREAVRTSRPRLLALCQDLVRIDSQNPPGSTKDIAEYVIRWLGARSGVTVERVAVGAVENLVVTLRTAKRGRRLVVNGHLDTFPVGDPAGWSASPLSGELRDGKLYGRGVSDMKAGLAASLIAFEAVHALREELCGELVLAFVGDEETGGVLGTQHLLANVPGARGDAMLNGDVGSPQVARFGEKGQVWVQVRAAGRSAHGAHVHLGTNAIDRLLGAIAAVRPITEAQPAIPPDIAAAIAKARAVSEPLSGEGESCVLRGVTMNVGLIEGGIAVNLVPDAASCKIDLRFPPGLSCADIERELAALLRPLPGIDFEVLSKCEPNVTDPEHEIVRLVCRHGEEATGQPVVANMRIGFSDARFYRHAGIPSVTYGPTPYNMGGSDEHILVSELNAVAEVHAATAYEFLLHPGS